MLNCKDVKKTSKYMAFKQCFLKFFKSIKKALNE